MDLPALLWVARPVLLCNTEVNRCTLLPSDEIATDREHEGTPLFDPNKYVVRKTSFISDLKKITIKNNKDIKTRVTQHVLFRTEPNFIKYSQQSVGICFMIFSWFFFF